MTPEDYFAVNARAEIEHAQRAGRCPDAGTCHHECAPDDCFRVRYCAPLSAYGQTWPPDVRATVLAAAESGHL